MTEIRRTRHSGIELARIVAMYLVITMHLNTQGGVLGNLTTLSENYIVEWLIQCVTYCAVDCYALISGYVGVTSSFRYSKIFYLWLGVVFYTILITGAFAIFVPGSVGIMDVIKALTPASSGQYWYFSAYFALLFFIPFLNYLLNELESEKIRVLGLTIILVFSIIPTIRHTDPFITDKGYSTIWLMSLYLIGGILRKNRMLEKFSTKFYAITFWVCVLFALGSKVLIEKMIFNWTGEIAGGALLISYISPIVILQAICLFGMFLNVHIVNQTINRVICTISGTTFYIFIIHEHPFIKHRFIEDCFVGYGEASPMKMVMQVLGTALVIFVLCSVIDLVRMQIFRVFYVNDHCELFCQRIGKNVKNVLDKKYKT